MQSLGVYLHIPFCDGKCNYCDFYSFKPKDNELDSYTDIMIKQVKAWSQKINNRVVDSVYFGGGTPSLLGTERLIRILSTILNSFKIAADCEITLEANPSSGSNLNFIELKNSGFNRVSLGMQSVIDKELKLLGRRHSKEDVINTIKKIKDSGIDNISLDVMLGIPEQTIDSLTKTLDFCISQNIKHISTYMLSIEPDTVFGRNRERYTFADDDLQAELYLKTTEHLKDNGFEHYEISNFCISNHRSRHNMRYWQLKEYLGLGPSAHSLINNKRFYYPESIDAFEINQIIADGEGRTAEEYIMLMLRTCDGINVSEYNDMFGEIPLKTFTKAKFYKNLGYIEISDNSIKLTEKGFLLSNTIIADLI